MKHYFNLNVIKILDKEKNNLKQKLKENIYLIKKGCKRKNELRNLDISHSLIN